jgi:hemoglobin
MKAKNLLAAAALLLCGAAWSQTPVLPNVADTYVPTTPANDSLFNELGGQAGVQRLTEKLLERLLADPRTGPFFKETDLPVFKEQFALQLCEVSGGPCKRGKNNMRKIHSGMDIDKASFNAVVEVLQQAMDAQGIGFGAQNRLLAQLAPMHRDVVNVQ